MTAGQWDPSGRGRQARPGGPDRPPGRSGPDPYQAPGQPAGRSGPDPGQPPRPAARSGPDRRKLLLVGGLTVDAGAHVGAAVLTQGGHRGGKPVGGDGGTSPADTRGATP